ncbi:hypothetical protein MHZ92_03860 [Sporosarcina sp. ACRSL]|uniref:hypothetical protein n=1 Tax=Sporosarcina sp. ACRSL TaxID=2918215 RepID=UPI001EF58EFD|nr:hypothetical protein [Sporosarcina sp. ACRSL]MCG7343256.1 hypothetical protein [Sporosarcina sp. ACRSL]
MAIKKILSGDGFGWWIYIFGVKLMGCFGYLKSFARNSLNNGMLGVLNPVCSQLPCGIARKLFFLWSKKIIGWGSWIRTNE